MVTWSLFVICSIGVQPLFLCSALTGLLTLKQRWPEGFKDVCLYSEICLVLASYNYRLTARRFIQELFMDLVFREVGGGQPHWNRQDKTTWVRHSTDTGVLPSGVCGGFSHSKASVWGALRDHEPSGAGAAIHQDLFLPPASFHGRHCWGLSVRQVR